MLGRTGWMGRDQGHSAPVTTCSSCRLLRPSPQAFLHINRLEVSSESTNVRRWHVSSFQAGRYKRRQLTCRALGAALTAAGPLRRLCFPGRHSGRPDRDGGGRTSTLTLGCVTSAQGCGSYEPRIREPGSQEPHEFMKR